jgi:5,5'-dehydrodivanillate O-demethylase
METPENNTLMTQVGKGTPGGELLRRYWHAIGVAAELDEQPTRRVRLLGEDLVVFRDRQGRLGLVQERCPHRRASLAYGFSTSNGIRCAYHGWEFDVNGKCINQPFEKNNHALCEKAAIAAYAVEELGGLLFAYLGPEPRPLLPRFDGFVVPGAIRTLGHALVPCNWLQIVETSVDPVHAEWLHGRYIEYQNEKDGVKTHLSASHERIDFREFEFGVTKHRLLEGESEDKDDWKIGHPVVFPTMLAVGNGDADRRSYAFQLRVPVDDENTMHYWYHAYVPPPGAEYPPRLHDRVYMHEVPFRNDDGSYRTDHIDAQDIMAWLTQGRIADRSKEMLGSSDQGVAMFRRLLRREIKKVQRGEDPIGVIRDPNRNVCIELPNEKNKKHFRGTFRGLIMRTHMQFSPVVEQITRMYDR